MGNKEKSKSNTNLAVAFIAVVVIIVLISFVFRIFWVIGESSFDPSNKYNLEIVDKNGIGVVSFSPKEKSISILKFEEKISSEELVSDLQIPIDAYLVFDDTSFDYANISSSLFSKAFVGDKKRKNLTTFDILRLSLFARGVPSATTYERKILKDYSQTQKSTVLSLTFTDPQIFSESKSIEVVNSTKVSGLGNRLANLITNMGGNVILVGSRDLGKKSKIVYFKDKVYTVKRLSEYLDFPIEEAKSRAVADVIIVIGEDALGKLKF